MEYTDADDMMNDPDRKEYYLLIEKLEFWRSRVYDEDLTEEEGKRAEERYIEVLDKSTSALQRFNRRWEKIVGPLPPLDEETLKYIRNKFSSDLGMEVTIEELKEALEGEDDEDSPHSEM